MRKNRRKIDRHVSMPEINLTPLIDTALVLLVVFMVTSPMLQNGLNIDVKLPEGNMQEVKESKQELIVSVANNGKLFFNNKEYELESLVNELKQQVPAHSDKTVFVKGDFAANYGKVIEVVDRIKFVGGVKYVALATARAA